MSAQQIPVTYELALLADELKLLSACRLERDEYQQRLSVVRDKLMAACSRLETMRAGL